MSTFFNLFAPKPVRYEMLAVNAFFWKKGDRGFYPESDFYFPEVEDLDTILEGVESDSFSNWVYRFNQDAIGFSAYAVSQRSCLEEDIQNLGIEEVLRPFKDDLLKKAKELQDSEAREIHFFALFSVTSTLTGYAYEEEAEPVFDLIGFFTESDIRFKLFQEIP